MSVYLDDGDVRLHHPDSLARYERGSRYDDQAEVDAVPYAATRPRGTKRRTVRPGVDTNGGGQGNGEMGWSLTLGANARSVWTIPTQPTPFAHFATFPEALVERCVKAGTSEHGACAQCGAPWARALETREPVGAWHDHTEDDTKGARPALNGRRTLPPRPQTIGWMPTCACGCGVVDPCTVLDPFMGSGTTALVARRLGRHAVGIELNAEYLAIAATRLQQLSLLGGAA